METSLLSSAAMDDSTYTNMRPRKYKIPKADSTDAAGGDSVAPGDIVKVHGLVNAAQHNGRTGVVLKKMESEGGCRFQGGNSIHFRKCHENHHVKDHEKCHKLLLKLKYISGN